MPSLAGHLDEALFFIMLSIWWMFNMFKEYIKVGCDGRRYRAKLSYPTPCLNYIPIEIIMKTLFPIVGFLTESFDHGPTFLDEHGQFREDKLLNIQHITIYSLFIVHGIVDLMDWLKTPMIKGLNYWTAVIAFAWYGYGFYFHTKNGLNQEPLESIVHLVPIILMFGAAISASIEYARKDDGGILPQFCRTYFVFGIGTWFTHIAFVLYDASTPFPSEGANPNWNRTDHRNVNFMVAAFGMHLNLNIVFMVAFYFVMYFIYKDNTHVTYEKCPLKPLKFSKRKSSEPKSCKCEEKQLLLSDSEEEV